MATHLGEQHNDYLDTLDAGDALGAPHGVGVGVGGAPHARHLLAPPQPRQRGDQARVPQPQVGAPRPRGAGARVVEDVLQAPGLA